MTLWSEYVAAALWTRYHRYEQGPLLPLSVVVVSFEVTARLPLLGLVHPNAFVMRNYEMICRKQTQNNLNLVMIKRRGYSLRAMEYDGHDQRAQNTWDRESSATTGRVHVRNEKDCTHPPVRCNVSTLVLT